MNCRSTVKSRTTGNFESGSMRIGSSSWSTSAEHAMRAFPLMTIAHEPHTSSKQLESYDTGVVCLPSRVTGFSAISRRQMITFIDARHGSANSSHRGASFGLACRFILTMTLLPSAISDLDFRQLTTESLTHHFAASYLRGRGGICEMSTGSYVS